MKPDLLITCRGGELPGIDCRVSVSIVSLGSHPPEEHVTDLRRRKPSYQTRRVDRRKYEQFLLAPFDKFGLTIRSPLSKIRLRLGSRQNCFPSEHNSPVQYITERFISKNSHFCGITQNFCAFVCYPARTTETYCSL